ncbi:MAG: hypothetical protein JWN76_1209 [Chitinophagaceae bacterium]|nr:hypothetical protein [Chitinophagaceae bacterium]
MKMQLINRFRKASVVVLLVSLLVSGLPMLSQASEGDTTNTKPTVQYLGSENNKLLFEVKLSNEKGEKFDVVVKEANGDVLFIQRYNDKQYNQKFQLPQPEDSNKITFIIRTQQKEYAESFQLAAETKLVSDIVVTRLK